jgi:hypothetical protein
MSHPEFLRKHAREFLEMARDCDDPKIAFHLHDISAHFMALAYREDSLHRAHTIPTDSK